MARRLRIDELASEAGIGVELIERLTEMGILEPQPDGWYGAGDLFRLEAANAFLEAGVNLDQLGTALSEGIFTFEYLDRFHPEPAPTTGRTFREFITASGTLPALMTNIYLAMGLPEPADDRLMREDEESLVKGFLHAWKVGPDEETYLRAARLIGEPARQVAEGWTRLYVEKVSDPLAGEQMTARDRIAAIVESTEELTRLAPPLMLWLFDRHLRNAIDRANIDGLEQQLVALGLSLPPPERPPAISFVDISGYTSLTEAHGDALAAETAHRLREQAERSARAHGGTVVKLLGDGAMLHFETVDEGLAGVLELVDRLGAVDVAAHAGMHAGPLIEHDRDYFGRTVNLASRITGVAGPGEVVVSGAVVSAVESDGYVFDPLSPVNLKGIGDSIVLYRAGLKSS
jgi:class 3 adenylate cyclase